MSADSPELIWHDRPTLETHAQPHYSDALPFHNWAHALAVADESLSIAARAAQHGLALDTAVMIPAALNHDAGFFLNPGVDHTFASKELYSANVVHDDLTLLRAPERAATHAAQIVASTQKGVACASPEAKAVRQADLANVSSNNPLAFLNGTYRLYAESKMLAGQRLLKLSVDPEAIIKDFVKFAAISYEILSAYNQEDISLGDFDRDKNGVSIFQKQAAKNIERLVPNRLTGLLQSKFGDIVHYKPIGL
jgi:hypothetical protein